MQLFEVVRNLAPYDFEISDEECRAIIEQAFAAVGPTPAAPHIFDTEGRAAHAEKYLVPLAAHMVSAKARLRAEKQARSAQ